jgi:hypothetical protein
MTVQQTKTCKQCSREFSRQDVTSPGNFPRMKYCGWACAQAAKPFSPEKREAAFWEKVDKSGGPDACWNWSGAVTAKWGYGCFHMGGNRVLGAHKIAYEYVNGAVPDGLCVLHKCDNRLCCNPAHHFLGTKLDNARDAVAKDRHARGERIRRNKLTDAQAVEIMELKGSISGCQLAPRYGVGPGTIHAIWRGATWKHLRRQA